MNEMQKNYKLMFTVVYSGIKSNSLTMSEFRILMQPLEPLVPIATESGDPWI